MHQTYHHRASLRALWAAFTATLLALAGLLVVLPTPAQAEEQQITEGYAIWGIKESWRRYAGAGAELSGGVEQISEGDHRGEYRWPISSGRYDSENHALTLDLSGSIRFRSYCHGEEGGEENCDLDSTFSNLRVVIEAGQQSIRGDYIGKDRDDMSRLISQQNVVLGTLDITTGEQQQDGEQFTWEGIQTRNGSEFQLYAPGMLFDPLTIRYTGTGGRPDLGEHFDAQGVPTFVEAQRWSQEGLSVDRTFGLVQRYLVSDPVQDRLYVMDRAPEGDAPSGRIIVLQGRDLQALGTVAFPEGVEPKYAPLVDPAGGILYMMTPLRQEASGGYSLGLLRIRTDDEGIPDDVQEIGTVHFDRRAEVKGLQWDAHRGAPTVFLSFIDTYGADEAEGALAVFSPTGERGPEMLSFSAPRRVSTDAGEGMAYPFESSSQASDFNHSSSVAILRDGSYLLTSNSNIYLDNGENRSSSAYWLNPETGEGKYVSGTSTPVIGDDYYMSSPYTHVAEDNSAMIFGDGAHSLFSYVDVRDGSAQVSTPQFTLGEGCRGFFGVIAGDSSHRVDYVLDLSSYKVESFQNQRHLNTLELPPMDPVSSPAFNTMDVTGDGSLVVEATDPETQQPGLLRIQLKGFTPKVTVSPQDQEVDLGADSEGTARFTVEAQDAESIRWQSRALGESDYTDIPDSTEQTLTVRVDLAKNGSSYRAVLKNSAGKVVSEEAKLTVKQAPIFGAHPQSADILENTAMTLTATATGNPEPTLTWQKRTGDGEWTEIAGDQVRTEGGTTVLDLGVVSAERSGTQYRVRALSEGYAPVYSQAAAITVHGAEIPEDGLKITDAVLSWPISGVVQEKPPFGSSNYLSAGVSDGDEITYRTEEGAVRVVHRSSAGTETAPSWDSRAAHIGDDQLTQQISFGEGEGQLAADGSGEIRWTGSFTINFYDGLVPATITDPVLRIDADGSGELRADLSGWGSSQSDPTSRHRVGDQKDVLISTFTSASGLDPQGTVQITPDYRGVQIEVPEGQTPQQRTGEDWGSWPQELVDFHFQSGLSSYWYSSGGSADSKKLPSPFTVTLSAQSGGDGQPTPIPSTDPTAGPSSEPSGDPSQDPSRDPSAEPNSEPTPQPEDSSGSAPSQGSKEAGSAPSGQGHDGSDSDGTRVGESGAGDAGSGAGADSQSDRKGTAESGRGSTHHQRLAHTGPRISGLIAVAAGLLGAGALGLWAARRRRSVNNR